MEQLGEERRLLQARLESDKQKIHATLAEIREDLRPLELLGDWFAGTPTRILQQQGPAYLLGTLAAALLPRKWAKHPWIGRAIRIFTPVLIHYLLKPGKQPSTGRPENTCN